MRIETMRNASLLVPLLMLSACGLLDDAHSQNESPARRVEITELLQSERNLTRRFSGYTRPWDAHAIGFLVGGRITDIKVDAGDEVSKGQLIATLSADDYALTKQLADVQEEAIAPNVKRIETLVEKKVLPKSQLDEVLGKYRAAKTQQQQAERQLAHTRLHSPCDGVVMRKEASAGQVIGPGMPVVIVLDLSRLKTEIGVTQSDLDHFRAGDAVEVRVRGFEQPVQGLVHHVGLVPDTTTRTFPVQIALDNPDQKLRPGLISHVDITTRRARGLFVPLHAIKRNALGENVVMLYNREKGQVREQKVSLGTMIGEEIEIQSGATEGDEIVVRGQEFVRSGDRVIVQ